MSVIAYKDGVLAADSRAYGGAYRASPGQKIKIHTLDDGTRVGVSTAVLGMAERYIAWLRSGADPDAFGAGEPDCEVLMVKPDGGVYITDSSLYFSGPIRCNYYAVGSGAKYAIGAMACGASAAEAVAIAAQFDPFCGCPVTTL